MKKITILLLFVTGGLFAQGTIFLNTGIGIEPHGTSFKISGEVFFQEDMSVQISYLNASTLKTAFATLNYSIVGTKSINLQTKMGLTLDKNIIAGTAVYYQVYPFVNIGVSADAVFKQVDFITASLVLSVDITQFF